MNEGCMYTKPQLNKDEDYFIHGLRQRQPINSHSHIVAFYTPEDKEEIPFYSFSKGLVESVIETVFSSQIEKYEPEWAW